MNGLTCTDFGSTSRNGELNSKCGRAMAVTPPMVA